jgi:hypothetical protein
MSDPSPCHTRAAARAASQVHHNPPASWVPTDPVLDHQPSENGSEHYEEVEDDLRAQIERLTAELHAVRASYLHLD